MNGARPRDPDAIRIVRSLAPVVHGHGTSYGMELSRIHAPKIIRSSKVLSFAVARLQVTNAPARFYAARFSHVDAHSHAVVFEFVQRLRISDLDRAEIPEGSAPGFAEVERFLNGDESALETGIGAPTPRLG